MHNALSVPRRGRVQREFGTLGRGRVRRVPGQRVQNKIMVYQVWPMDVHVCHGE